MSPALGPWGIPDELDGFEVVVLAGVELVFAGAGAVVVGALVVVAAGVLLVLEEEELLPQPAAMTAATASATNGTPRTNLDLLIMRNLCRLSCRW
jgi:hypothetical protein